MTDATAVPEYEYGRSLVPSDPHAYTSGMWRWELLLPLSGKETFPLSVGGTPLVDAQRLGQRIGIANFFLKDETRGFSGSNKDRASALCVTDALEQGRNAVACASTGNVAASLTVAAAAVGLDSYVFMSRANASEPKISFMRSFGGNVMLFDGGYEEAYELSRQACQQYGWYERNTASNPLCPEAKKTVAFEIWEQLGRIPDVAILPVGDGVTLAAFELGCRELVQCGVAENLPRIVGVQAEGAAALVRAFEAGESSWTPVDPDTVADGIAVGAPLFGDEVLDAISRTDGELISVSDTQMSEAIKLLSTTTGILAEPAGAATVAGAAEWISRYGDSNDLTVVALVTGTGLKDQRFFPLGGTLTEISSIDDVESAMPSPVS